MVPKVKRFREWLLAEMERAIREADGGWGHAEDAAPDGRGRGLDLGHLTSCCSIEGQPRHLSLVNFPL